MNRNELKAKLWAAIDALEDHEGFVLTAVSDDIQFTRLKADRTWEDVILELEPLNEPEARSEMARLGRINDDLRAKNAILETKVAENRQLLANLEAAVANMLGARKDEAA